MTIFETRKRWNKINFVDVNNVFVGYDYEQSCCEDFGYYITAIENPKTIQELDEAGDLPDDELNNYCFDEKYKKDICFAGGDISAVMFRLVADGKKDLFLLLYNAQNGYYGHGFEFKVQGKMIKNGYL